MSCSNCSNQRVLAKGLCGACYHRLRKTGQLAKVNISNIGRVCSHDGCGQPAWAKGLCPHHYSKAEHPLKAVWKIIRSRNPDACPATWDKFDGFLADVGERPSPKHQLKRHDESLPYTKENAFWRAPLGIARSSYSKEQQAAYGREHNLRTRFKITGEEYARLLSDQGGGCAVCGRKETHAYASGKLKDLSVDHDHATGKVRGLLCFNHNQGIGRFQDSPILLRAAADYLDHHATMTSEEIAA